MGNVERGAAPSTERKGLTSARPLRKLIGMEVSMKPCEYCGAKPAKPVIVPEPTEHSTYRRESRTLCPTCFDEYKDTPWGFELES